MEKTVQRITPNDFIELGFDKKTVEKTDFTFLNENLPSMTRQTLKQRLNALAKDFGKTREQLTKEHGNKILGHLQIFGLQQEKDDYSLKQRLNALAKDFGKTREQLT
ncbi:hypothetical protein HZC09_00760, partial [Candidatus Micrarchaeota archaeon]|nr:hypothetical protein [Candidatus Micrarchaeota archaeon]